VRFNRYGFDRVSLKRIAAGAGQMDSGFYGYFESENEPPDAQALGCLSTDPESKSCGERVAAKSATLELRPDSGKTSA
jgi:hypothetical protein